METEVMKCPMCNKHHKIKLTYDEYERLYDYRHGYGTIQEQFPDRNKVEREFLKTGYCPQCQEMVFGDGETDNIKSAKEFDR